MSCENMNCHLQIKRVLFCFLLLFLFSSLLIITNKNMIKQKTCWTEDQDAALTQLYEQRKIDNWNEVARLLKQEYNFPQKLPKDCKERYLNNLNSVTLKIQWSLEDEKQFIKLHNDIGNKWATIAQHLPGKTDNCVKNHFYSKLRKLLRKLNKIIQFSLKKQFRPIDISILYKIVEAAEQRFKDKPNCETWVSNQCHNVQNLMLEFAMFKDTSSNNDNDKDDDVKIGPQNLQQYRQLIKQIYRVSKLYKRKSKKVRNSLIQAPINNSKKKTKKETIKGEQIQDDQDDIESHQELYKPKQKISPTIVVRKLHHQAYDKTQGSVNILEKPTEVKKQNNNVSQKKYHPLPHSTNTRIQVEEGQGIQQLLRTAGILQDEIKPTKPAQSKNRKSSMISQYSALNMPSPLLTPISQPHSFIQSNLGVEYSPLHSFSPQQVENFLGFSMVNNTTTNNFNFTLSEKSSFKSYSERDPSEIDNPFFDQYSSNNGRIMFPMNFNMAATHQYSNPYNEQTFGTFQYGNAFYNGQSGQQEEGQSYVADPKGN